MHAPSVPMLLVERGGQLYGWIYEGGCGHPVCKKAIGAGRAFHATPADPQITLPDDHFATQQEAETALLALTPHKG